MKNEEKDNVANIDLVSDDIQNENGDCVEFNGNTYECACECSDNGKYAGMRYNWDAPISRSELLLVFLVVLITFIAGFFCVGKYLDGKINDATSITKTMMQRMTGTVIDIGNDVNRINKSISVKDESKVIDKDTPFLGIEYLANSGDDAFLKIQNVYKGSSADKAGIKKGDIILSINNTNVSPKNVSDVLRSYSVGDKIKVVLLTTDGQSVINKGIEMTVGGYLEYLTKSKDKNITHFEPIIDPKS